MLCIVTYTRENEEITDELNKIFMAFYAIYKDLLKVVICCEKTLKVKNVPYCIEYFNVRGTKYRRLIQLMDRDDSEYYLSIDNDITGNIPALLNFVEHVISCDYEVGWGRILSKRRKGFISNLVAVDKLLSHNIIRPTLWKFGIGISIPGQIFCIKRDAFRGKLLDINTFLDDLALGLYVNIHKSKKYIVSSVLGYENPNCNFYGLIKQRHRWALGYSTIYKYIKSNKIYKNRIIIHGLSYHCSWIINWIIIFLLVLFNWKFALIYVLLISFFISKNDKSLFLYALVYQFVFPIFHIEWINVFIKEILKGD